MPRPIPTKVVAPLQPWERELAAALIAIARSSAARKKAAAACETATAQEERRHADAPANQL